MPKVSIIIPMFNATRYIRETLESVLKQTLQDIQIICVDDVSQDDTVDIISAYDDPRIVLLRNKQNSGTGATINVGLRVATGEYIQILGNDDLLEPEAMEHLYSFCKSEGVECCQYGVEVFLDDETDERARIRKKEAERYHEVRHAYGIMSGVELLEACTENNEYRMSNGPEFISRTLLSDNQIENLEGAHHEDMLFTWRVLIASKRATLLPDRYYRYRIHLDSLQAQREERCRSSEEALSLLRLTMGMYKATPKRLIGSHEFEPVLRRHVDLYLLRSATLYSALSEDEKERFDIEAQCLFRGVFPLFPLAGDRDALKKSEEALRQSEKKLRLAEEEAQRIKRSKAYRVGSAILWMPRKIKMATKR